MKTSRGAVCLVSAALIFSALPASLAQQRSREVRRAQPVDEPPVAKAVPFATPTPAPSARPRRSAPPSPPEPGAAPRPSAPASNPEQPPPESPPAETEAPDRRQLDYANALFSRKLYDLAVPEYQKYLDDYPGRSGRANAYFSLGECSRNLNRPSSARTNFQKVLSDYGDSEFAGPAAYALAEMAFTQKDYAAALPLFHRSAAKSKESAVALSARYFEARCLEILGRKDEASDIYQEVE